MKYLLLTSLFLHTGIGSWFHKTYYPEVDLMQVRLAPWQINFQRIIYYTDTCYAVQFRDQSTVNGVAVKTLDLETLEQMRYFRDGLISLKKGHNGDVAEFRNYTLKRTDANKEDRWYILSYDGAVTNFQEAQANRMIFIINNLIASQK